MNYLFTLCRVCNFSNTRVDNGDCEGCSECFSIEQGFDWLEELEDGSFVTEDGDKFDGIVN